MGASAFETPPEPQAIAKADELGRGSAVSMAFIEQGVTAMAKKLRILPDYNDILEAIRTSIESLAARGELLARVSKECWYGTAEEQQVEVFKSGTFNHVDGSAIQGIKKLNANLGKGHELSDIILVYDVDNNAQFNRGYMVNQEVMDVNNAEHKKILDVLDKIVHSWLVTNGMRADDTGVVFHKTEGTNRPKKTRPDDILRLIADEDKGLINTVKKLDPNINLSLVYAPPELQEEAKHRQSSEAPNTETGVQPNQ